MAKIASSFQCMVCKERCNFPNDISIVQFQMIFLKFYCDHDDEKKCEAKVEELRKLLSLEKNEVKTLIKKSRSKNANRSAKS
jgi:hypothetical protein